MSEPTPSAQQPERRHRGGLRAMIDEMMEQIRAVSNDESWTPEERRRAEADLARIMDQVKQEALARPGA